MQYHVALFTEEELANLAADYPAGKTFTIQTNGKRYGTSSLITNINTETITIVKVEKVIKKAYWGDVAIWTVFYKTDYFRALNEENRIHQMFLDKFICLVN